MSEPTELFRKQSEWQRERAQLSWGEKLEMALTLREAALALRRVMPLRGRTEDDPNNRHSR
jgi:hypothetical protein